MRYTATLSLQNPASLRTCLTIALVVSLLCAVAQAQTVSTVYSFVGGSTSGQYPWYVTLVQGTNGSLYGTTYGGGATSAGTIFSVTTSGTQTLLHSFKGGVNDGANPTGGLTLGTDGNFYGTTQQGGTGSQGVVFKITPAGVLTILHNFNAGTDGTFPWGPPILASDGNFYGTTSGGGTKGGGIVYQITSTGTFSTIYNFDIAHGFAPIAPPVQGTDGFLYIPVSEGGDTYCGTIVQLSTAGVLNNSYSFPCGSGGSFPIGPLVQASNGNFYSTTQNGGTAGEGTIYQVTAGLAVKILHNFGAIFGDCTFPGAGMLLATDGKYYSSASDGGAKGDGCLFNTTTSGAYKGLYSFNNTSNGTQISPLAPPVQLTSGLLYGVTEFGGASNAGTVYSLNMGLPAFVNLPLFSGRQGQSVLILGSHLKGTSAVTFNGKPAKFTVLSDTHMKATVPAGATSGFIRVATPRGILEGRKEFRVMN